MGQSSNVAFLCVLGKKENGHMNWGIKYEEDNEKREQE